jgi:hypothetical protein
MGLRSCTLASISWRESCLGYQCQLYHQQLPWPSAVTSIMASLHAWISTCFSHGPVTRRIRVRGDDSDSRIELNTYDADVHAVLLLSSVQVSLARTAPWALWAATTTTTAAMAATTATGASTGHYGKWLYIRRQPKCIAHTVWLNQQPQALNNH